jgi:hypothetical protein
MTLKNWKSDQTIITCWQLGASWQISDSPLRKGVKQRNKPPTSQHRKNPNPKQDGFWTIELISRTWGKDTPYWRSSWLRSCHWKTGKKKTGESPQPPGKTKETFCLNTNTRTGCWRSNSRITKTEILFFLNLEFFMCLFDHLFVLFPVCLSTLLLISLVFFFFSFFVLLVLLLWDS